MQEFQPGRHQIRAIGIRPDGTRGAHVSIVVKDRQFTIRDKYKGLRSEYIIKKKLKDFRLMLDDLTHIAGETTRRLLPIMPPSPFDKRYYKEYSPARGRIILKFVNEVLEIIMQNEVLRCTNVFSNFVRPPPSYSRKKT